MELYKKVLIKNLEELEEFAKKISLCLKGNELILLEGNLGAGKTTFTRFLVASIGEESGEYVNSPTFSIMNQYDTDKFTIYHIDLYRVKDFDFSDVIGEGLVIVEWADEDLVEIDNPVVLLKFSMLKDDQREIKIFLKNSDYMKKCI
ncbi:tRNA (adenosine(37)-N6)-threonylcarbamoyltransferase complex ATPase subunit type 1 TsaE [Persephonella sp.]